MLSELPGLAFARADQSACSTQPLTYVRVTTGTMHQNLALKACRLVFQAYSSVSAVGWLWLFFVKDPADKLILVRLG
jgi:hypothetical protein